MRIFDYKSVEITTKIGCRNNCDYCPQKKITKNYSKRSNKFQLSFLDFKKCIDKIPRNIEIHFSGFAEPFLNPQCSKMILYAYHHGFEISVFTTAIGLDATDIDLLEKVNYKEFIIHLPNKKNNMNIDINKNYLYLLEKLLQSKIKNKFCISPGVNKNKLNPKIISILNRNSVPFIKSKITDRASNLKLNKKKLKGKLPKCSRLRRNVLLPNGEVVLCCNDYGLKHILGNLLFSGYESLFKSQEFMVIKNGLKKDSDILCRYCSLGEIYQSMPFLKKIFKINFFLHKLRNKNKSE